MELNKSIPVISLTTLPRRIELIEPVIESLLNQHYDVYLYVPEYVERLGQKFDGNIPKFLKHKKIHIEIVEDLGPFTKLWYSVLKGFEYIITADDDVIYPDDWASELVDAKKLYETVDDNSVVCYRGRIIKGKYNESKLIKKVTEPELVNFVTGTWGAIYSSRVFSDDILEMVGKHPMVDDVVISSYLKAKNIPIYVIPEPDKIVPYQTHRIDALYKTNNGKHAVTNDNALKDLGFYE